MLDAGKAVDEIAVEINRTSFAIYGRLQRLYRKVAREARQAERGLEEKGK
jgi:hypothetical protein